MQLTMSDFYDVLVIGSGIAGLSAAVEAAQRGCSTAIVCNGPLFSGSSFYPGTWGFGLVGPENRDDEDDLIQTVCTVGCGAAEAELVESFIRGINPAIDRLKALGCRPRKADNTNQREYIPCFDHKHRNWNGLEAPEIKRVFTEQIRALNIRILETCSLLDIVKRKNRVYGIVAQVQEQIHHIGCGALILATGGYGSLFKYHLCPDTVTGVGQFLALRAGCRLVNMEFMQMMLGFLEPARNTIFNEKTFRFANFRKQNGMPLFEDDEAELLDLRSGYGPFTSRLPSRLIDQKIHREFLDSGKGVSFSYADSISENTPEFIQVYFDWLHSAKGISAEDSIQVALFSHAANGGIQIDVNGQTDIPGLFACGEATGGMHGADRIGGLSTANCLVFGQRAGISAADYVSKLDKEMQPAAEYSYRPLIFEDPEAIRQFLKDTMYQNAFALRNAEGLSAAVRDIQALLSSGKRQPQANPSDILRSSTAEASLVISLCILKAALLRSESRGSHFREDFPAANSNMARPIYIHLEEGSLRAEFRNQ